MTTTSGSVRAVAAMSRSGASFSSAAAAAALAAALALAACGPSDPPPVTGTGPATGTKSSAGGGSGPGTRPATPRAAPPSAFDFKAEPLTRERAQRLILEAAEAAASPDALQDALLALAATSDIEAVRKAAAPSLAAGDDVGGYADADAAAGALEALVRAGDADAQRKALALGAAAVRDDTPTEGILRMLASIEGAAAPEARKLLIATLDSLLQDSAVRILAPLREKAAATKLHEIATSVEGDESATADVRATAAAGLLALGDARAQGVLDGLTRDALAGDAKDAVQPFDLMDALALDAVPETLPWIRRLADPAIAAGENVYLEIRSLAAAYAGARGPGNGTPEDIAALRALLGKEDGLADEEIVTALWTLGDEQQSAAAAEVLARYVQGVASAFDEDLTVRILDALGTRRGATREPFAKIVEAAAQVPIPNDARRPDAAGRAWRVRVAAARAYLASNR